MFGNNSSSMSITLIRYVWKLTNALRRDTFAKRRDATSPWLWFLVNINNGTDKIARAKSHASNARADLRARPSAFYGYTEQIVMLSSTTELLIIENRQLFTDLIIIICGAHCRFSFLCPIQFNAIDGSNVQSFVTFIHAFRIIFIYLAHVRSLSHLANDRKVNAITVRCFAAFRELPETTALVVFGRKCLSRTIAVEMKNRTKI